MQAPSPPVVLLVFNRPEVTRRMLEAVRLARPPVLLVVADGPRLSHPGDREACARVREMIETQVDWSPRLLTQYAETNQGLRQRVSSGLNWAFSLVEEAIILEDDCVPTPDFFRFCGELLERYRHDARIAVITGDNFQPQPFACAASYYFSKYAHCWGWASWRRAWQHFDGNMTRWPALRDAGWLGGLFPNSSYAAYWKSTFDTVHQGQLNSWALAWLFSCWSQSMLAVLPRVNLVQNVGFGTQASNTLYDSGGILNPPVLELDWPLRHPECVVIDSSADDFTQRWVFGPAPSIPTVAPAYATHPTSQDQIRV